MKLYQKPEPPALCAFLIYRILDDINQTNNPMKTFYLVQDAGTSQGLFLPKEGNPMKPKVSMNSLPLSELNNYAFEDFEAAEAFVNRNPENTSLQIRQVQLKVTK